MYNQQDEITEASSSNVFIVEGNTIKTPPLDNQLLPGITRLLVLKVLRQFSEFDVQEVTFTKETLLAADEVWITSSTKEIAPVIEVGGHAIGDGTIGKVWLAAQALFSQYKFEE